MPATELSTRDVLQQVDRRLSRVEDLQLRHEERTDQAHASMIERFDRALVNMGERNDQAHVATNERFERAHAALDSKIDRNLRWTITLILGSWMTTMSAILLK